jgi:tRNA(fMet)-specific endonuclease VapC
MYVLDMDMVTLIERGQERVNQRLTQATRAVVTTEITRMEILQGRFASVLKAEDGERLLIARQRLEQAEARLQSIRILPIAAAAAAEFDRLLGTKGLRKIGRADLLIAAIVLANKATLVTRNRRDFQKVPGLLMENWAD